MPKRAELARRRQGQRDDAALGRGIGGLADLALEGGDRGGRDDDAALAVAVRLGDRHVRAAASRIMLNLPTRLTRMTLSKASSGIGPRGRRCARRCRCRRS